MKKGRKPADFSKTMDGIWWILATGAPWNQLPERYGKWNSVYRFFLRWSKRGVFEELLEEVVKQSEWDDYKVIDGSHVKVHQDACYECQGDKPQSFGATKGGRNSKLHAVTNSKGLALKVIIRPGNEAEIKTASEVLGDVSDKIVLADKGYDSDALREDVWNQGGFANIRGRKNRIKEPLYFKNMGKKRHVVENFFQRVKRFRRVATRYDRLDCTYLSFVIISALADWVKN